MKSVNRKSPKVGFVSLGCPKALVDSERILTRLRAEGYEVVPTYREADLVVVNTCGFIDAAVDESLQAIGEALAENGKVIVTGCLGAQPQKILDRHPQVLKITGPQRYEEVVAAVHEHLPPKHEPFVDLVPAQGVKLTPRHYSYLKISEGCNHRCSFCIIPSMRGDLNSRPVGEVLREAEQLVRAGVKEILVISQDTSAYGVDLKYAAQPWRNVERRARFYDLSAALGELGVWIRLHYVYPYPHVDQVVELMAQGKILPYLDIPFQHASARILKLMKRPAGGDRHLAAHCRMAAHGAGHDHPQHLHRGFPRRNRAKTSKSCSTGCGWRNSIGLVASNTRRFKARRPTRSKRLRFPRNSRPSAAPASWNSPVRSAPRASSKRSAARCRCSSIASAQARPTATATDLVARSASSP